MDAAIAQSAPVPGEVRRLLEALPDWFGIPEAVDEYVDAATRMPTLTARDRTGATVGVLLLERHFPEAAEIHLMAVAPALHRSGIGRALVEKAAETARADGASLLSVKTLGPSHPDRFYARTRAFYRACGFLPLEELDGVWPGNPCLVLVQHLRDPGDAPRDVPNVSR